MTDQTTVDLMDDLRRQDEEIARLRELLRQSAADVATWRARCEAAEAERKSPAEHIAELERSA